MTIPHAPLATAPPPRIGFLRPWILPDVRWCFQVRIWKEVNFKRWNGTSTNQQHQQQQQQQQPKQQPKQNNTKQTKQKKQNKTNKSKSKQNNKTTDNNNLQLITLRPFCKWPMWQQSSDVDSRIDKKIWCQSFQRHTFANMFVEFPGVSKKACKWLYNIRFLAAESSLRVHPDQLKAIHNREYLLWPFPSVTNLCKPFLGSQKTIC